LKFDLNDENDDLDFFDPNLKMKSAMLKALAQGALIDLDSLPKLVHQICYGLMSLITIL
jgi:hypothetical protein